MAQLTNIKKVNASRKEDLIRTESELKRAQKDYKEKKALLEEKGITFDKLTDLEQLEQTKAARVDSILANMAEKLGL
jgi:nitrogenase molybdenum-iron protein alpha/beta subunit